MTYPHIESQEDYDRYKAAVDRFFEREGIENLTHGRTTCAECNADLHQDGIHEEKCQDCGADVEYMNEPSFSWTPCDCCGRNLGGDRYPASGYNRDTGDIFEYQICIDCLYFSEYGTLDDMTMIDYDLT